MQVRARYLNFALSGGGIGPVGALFGTGIDKVCVVTEVMQGWRPENGGGGGNGESAR